MFQCFSSAYNYTASIPESDRDMPLPQARKIAAILGTIITGSLMLPLILRHGHLADQPWRSVLVYGLGLLVPVAGSILSQNLYKYGNFGAPRFFTSWNIGLIGGLALYALIGLVRWQIPPAGLLGSHLVTVFFIGVFGMMIVPPLLYQGLRLIRRFIRLAVNDLHEAALQIAFAGLSAVELFLCWL